jgi:hypothetical protein
MLTRGNFEQGRRIDDQGGEDRRHPRPVCAIPCLLAILALPVQDGNAELPPQVLDLDRSFAGPGQPRIQVLARHERE